MEVSIFNGMVNKSPITRKARQRAESEFGSIMFEMIYLNPEQDYLSLTKCTLLQSEHAFVFQMGSEIRFFY